jgi:hypothetical protein
MQQRMMDAHEQACVTRDPRNGWFDALLSVRDAPLVFHGRFSEDHRTHDMQSNSYSTCTRREHGLNYRTS